MSSTSPVPASLLALGLFFMQHAVVYAASSAPAVVEGVQMPAWIERGSSRRPVTLGTVLQQSDRLITGLNARILLRLAEGSKVKLGENAQLNLGTFEIERKDKSIFLKSVLNVVRGAFRFTTEAAAKLQNRRRVDIVLATATVGIRGTDVWGKQGTDRETVCLIEGVVAVGRVREGKAPEFATLDKPMSFFVAPTDMPAQRIATVSSEQLTQWAAETEMAAGAGVQSLDGKWQVTFISSANFNAAYDVRDALRKQGYPVEISPALVAGNRIYHVRLTHLSGKEDAQMIANRIGSEMNLNPEVGL
jgi:hypothetical protein